MAIGAYPGSFNPPTLAHLAIAEAAVRQGGLDRVELIVSRRPLGKGDIEVPSLDDRLDVLRSLARTRPWLGVQVTDAQLLVDIAAGYDALIVGADKWVQLHDPAWYGDARRRDEAIARLPHLLVAARPPHALPADVPVLDVDPHHHIVSSSAVRDGQHQWMAPEAAAFDRHTGAWSDPGRYRTRRRAPEADIA